MVLNNTKGCIIWNALEANGLYYILITVYIDKLIAEWYILKHFTILL